MKNIDFFIGKRSKDLEVIGKKLDFNILFVKEIISLDDFRNLKQESYDACLINTCEMKMLIRLIDKASRMFKMVLVLGTEDNLNRAALENKKVHGLVAPEYNRKKDLLSQRTSGLNHVLCRLAKTKKKIIIFRFSDIKSKIGKDQAIFFGKLQQNLTLCRKYNCKYIIANFTSKKQNLVHKRKLKEFEKTLLAKNVFN